MQLQKADVPDDIDLELSSKWILSGYCVEEGMDYIAHCDGKREQTLVEVLLCVA